MFVQYVRVFTVKLKLIGAIPLSSSVLLISLTFHGKSQSLEFFWLYDLI